MAGVASPYNFIGLVRHYFMRRGCNVADIQVNLVGNTSARAARAMTSPNAVRPAVAAIAERYGVESPSPKCRQGRLSCKRSSRRFTDPRGSTSEARPKR